MGKSKLTYEEAFLLEAHLGENMVASTGDAHILMVFHKLIRINPPRPILTAALLIKLMKLERTRTTKQAASSKNAAARNWVQNQWMTHGHTAETKKMFAEDHIELVKKKFKNGKGGELEITFKTIYTEWLKGL
jgi:hypothetical protein